MLWRALRDVEKVFYVDVGAADPEEWSVTWALPTWSRSIKYSSHATSSV